MSGKEKLLSLLFDEGRKLINFRFFPGDKVTSADDLCEASYDALRQALASEEEQVPGISRAQVSFGELAKAKLFLRTYILDLADSRRHRRQRQAGAGF